MKVEADASTTLTRCEVDGAFMRTLAETAPLKGVGGKLEGCLATPISALLASVTNKATLAASATATFTAADTVCCDPIMQPDLLHGFLVHSTADGKNDLPDGMGGPLRVVYPDGMAIQTSICGTPKPVNLKNVVLMKLSSS